MLNFENILNAYNEVCKNTKNKRKVNLLKEDKAIFVYNTYSILNNKSYVVGPYNMFAIYEPKKRIIASQGIQDKIINHLVTRYILYPVILPCLIDQNVASRINLGTKAGEKLYRKYRNACNLRFNEYYILKCDIYHFFQSIDHYILKQKLLKRIKDKDAIKIVFDIIDSNKTGLGIGSMANQALALFYLDSLDHYIKEELKIKYYVRYQDDFLLFHESKDYLKFCLDKIKEFLNEEKLALNNKTRIYKNTDKFIFLGKKIDGSSAKYRSVRRKINKLMYLYKEGTIPLRSIVSSMICYLNRYESFLRNEE